MIHKNYSVMWDTPFHWVEIEIPPVKIFGFTVKKGYTILKTIDCCEGQTPKERLREGIRNENVLFKQYWDVFNRQGEAHEHSSTEIRQSTCGSETED